MQIEMYRISIPTPHSHSTLFLKPPIGGLILTLLLNPVIAGFTAVHLHQPLRFLCIAFFCVVPKSLVPDALTWA